MYPPKDRTRYNEYFKIAQRDRYRERKALAISLLGGTCVCCGSEQKLEFDHIDPSTKSFTICDRINGANWNLILEELTKCQLLCRPCHIHKTKEDRRKKPRQPGGMVIPAVSYAAPTEFDSQGLPPNRDVV